MSLLIPEFLRDAAWLDAALDMRHSLNVAEVGCGQGQRCRLWASRGHHVFGVDHDGEQIALARRHAFAGELEIMFDVARASALPWPGRCMDLCLGPAPAGSGADWQACLAELGRVLRPDGFLWLGSGATLRRYRRGETGETFTAA